MRGEILATARRECEEIIIRAQQEAEACLAAAETEAGKVRQERLDQAHAEAARRRESILATVPVETGRMRSARIEELLRTVHDEVRRRLKTRESLDYRAVVIALAAEAIKRMPGSSFVVKFPAADYAALGEGVGEDIARLVGRVPLRITIANDATVKEGGPVIHDVESGQVWDNSLLSRLDRFWPELRRQIAVQTSLVAGSGSTGGAP